VTADPSVRACRFTDLRVTHDGHPDGGGGSLLDTLTLTNAAPTPCRLQGRLEAISGVNAGVRRELPVHTASGGYFGGTVPVVLSPGESGRVDYSWYPRCDFTPGVGDSTYRRLRVTLLGGTLAVGGTTPADLDLGCAEPSKAITAGELGDFGAAREQVPDAGHPTQDLGVTLQVPATVKAGSVLRYVVAVSNPGTEQALLDPCPNFLQALGGSDVKDPHALNCAQAHPIPAGGTETFAMELAVPATAASGPTTLFWTFSEGVSVGGTAELVVEGGTDPGADVQECTPASTTAPCTAGMEVGKEYPFKLGTHCGIRELYADGRLWVPQQPDPPLNDGSGNPPPGIDNPYDTGTAVLAKPDVRLEWQSRRGNSFVFRPRTASDPDQGGCE